MSLLVTDNHFLLDVNNPSGSWGKESLNTRGAPAVRLTEREIRFGIAHLLQSFELPLVEQGFQLNTDISISKILSNVWVKNFGIAVAERLQKVLGETDYKILSRMCGGSYEPTEGSRLIEEKFLSYGLLAFAKNKEGKEFVRPSLTAQVIVAAKAGQNSGDISETAAAWLPLNKAW